MARATKGLLRKRTLKAAGGFEGIAELDAALKEIGQSIAAIDTAIVAVDRRIAPHAHLVEYGTQHSKSKSFFRTAIMTRKNEVSKTIGTEIGKVIEGTRADGKDIMLEGAKTFQGTMLSTVSSLIGKDFKPHPFRKGSKHIIYPGDLSRGIVTRKYARTTAGGMYIKD